MKVAIMLDAAALTALLAQASDIVNDQLKKIAEKRERSWEDLVATASALGRLVELHMTVIDGFLSPLVQRRDLHKTAELYNAFLGNPILSSHYDRIIGALRAALDVPVFKKPETRLRIKGVIDEYTRFSKAAFVVNWSMDSYVLGDTYRSAWHLYEDLPALGEVAPVIVNPDLDVRKAQIAKAFHSGIEWLETENQGMAVPRTLSIDEPRALNTKEALIDLTQVFSREWQRHINYVLSGRHGLFYVIGQLQMYRNV